MNKKIFFLFTAFLFCFGGVVAQNWSDTIAAIEKAFSRYKPAAPGAQLAIGRNGTILFSKAWGMADLEHDIPLTTTSVTEAGSVSKQFTAAAILLLEKEGKLSLDDDVHKYIPELPDYGHSITLRQMMQHTSGLKDWGSIANIAGWPRSTKTYSNDDALYIASLQQTLNNIPGAEFIYSNTNYNLFAVIVQRVSGMPLDEFSRRRLFEPAGMTHTEWRSNYKKIVKNRAIAYSKAGNNHLMNMPNEYVYGNGGLLTTAEDLVKWTEYIHGGKLGGPTFLERQLSSSKLNNGTQHFYAAGLFLDEYKGWKTVYHDGATAGYRSHLEHYPELGLTISWLSNTSEFDRDPAFLIDSIRIIFIREKSPSSARNVNPPVVFNDFKTESYAGWYRNPRSGTGMKIYSRNNKVFATQIGELLPLSANTLKIGNSNSLLRFTSQKGKELLYTSESKDSIFFAKVDSAVITDKLLKDYEGEYYSPEAETTIKIKIKNGSLTWFQDPKTEILLTPSYIDAFDGFFGSMYFERNKSKKITGFKVTVSRARNVSFVKLDKPVKK